MEKTHHFGRALICIDDNTVTIKIDSGPGREHWEGTSIENGIVTIRENGILFLEAEEIRYAYGIEKRRATEEDHKTYHKRHFFMAKKHWLWGEKVEFIDGYRWEKLKRTHYQLETRSWKIIWRDEDESKAATETQQLGAV